MFKKWVYLIDHFSYIALLAILYFYWKFTLSFLFVVSLFYFFLPGIYPDDHLPEVLSSTARSALESTVKKIWFFCPTMKARAPEVEYCNYSQDAPGVKLTSSYDAFKDTWLAVPAGTFPSNVTVDWSPEFQCQDFSYPTGSPASFKHTVPLPLRKSYGFAPLALPVTFSNPRMEKFFGSSHWLTRSNKINLKRPFTLPTFNGNAIFKALASAECISKEALREGSVLFDVLDNFNIRLASHKQWALDLIASESSASPQLASNSDVLALIEEFISLMGILRPIVRRTNLLSASAVMTVKKQARELVLARFAGLSTVKSALLHSDFGVPELFGSLNSEMQSNVGLYDLHDNRTWILSLKKSDGKRSSSSVSPQGPAKVPKKTNAAHAAPSASVIPSPFQVAGRGRGKGRGKGRGTKKK